MNIRRVLYNMGTWAKQTMFQRHILGAFLVLWRSVSRLEGLDK